MWYNPIIIWLLRSRLHWLLSLNMMLITYTGNHSGKKITVPVSYVRDDNTLWVISLRKRTWWRSLRGGGTVTLRLQGKESSARAEALVDDLPAKTAGLTTYIKELPEVGKAIDIRYDANKHPLAEDVAREAEKRVIIRIQLPSLPEQ